MWIFSYKKETDKHYAFKNIEDNYFTLMPGETRVIGLGEHEVESEGGIGVTSYEVEALKEVELEVEEGRRVRVKTLEEVVYWLIVGGRDWLID